MELVYIWINESQNTFIHETGINFSNSINFHCEKRGNKIVLECWDVKIDNRINSNFHVLQSDVIKNVKAIVGENGSGKTTLLKHICDRSFFAIPKVEEKGHYDYAQSVFVFEVSGEYKIYHNFNEFANHTKYQDYQYNEKDSHLLEIMRETLESVTRIYLSNSSFDNEMSTYSSHE